MTVRRNTQARFVENLIKSLEGSAPVKESTSYEDKISGHTNATIFNEMAEGRRKDARYRDFIKSTKVALLGECLNKIYTGALTRVMVESEVTVDPKQIIASYIEEKGVDNILSDIRYKSVLLSEFYQMVNKYTDMVMEKTDCKEGEEFKIPEEIRDKFYDDLNMEDTDDVVFQISDRVNDAIDEFVSTNTLNKMNIKDMLTSAAEKIESAKSEVQKESVQRIVNQRIHTIRNSGLNNIFSIMVENSASAIMKDQSLRESYMDGTSLDMARIVNTCKMSYTLMEMTQYIKLETLDEATVLGYINSI